MYESLMQRVDIVLHQIFYQKKVIIIVQKNNLRD